jgi:copper(I)-binding protein
MAVPSRRCAEQEVWMKARVVLTIMAVALWAAALARAQEPAKPAPEAAAPAVPVLTVAQEKIDLGTVKAGTDAVATFTLQNKGAVEVKVLSAKPS